MSTSTDQQEISALKMGAFINLLMAVAGWVAYSIANSEALLLDGNFSFISVLTTIGAIIIIKKKHTRTDLFPFGKYFYESLFTLSKGILILGLVVAALAQNLIRILDYIQAAGPIEKLKTGPIMIYMALMLVLCFGMAQYYHIKNKRIQFRSPILAVESKSSKIDGWMTLAVGAALSLSALVPEDSLFSFLLYIGDAIIVVLMCLFLLRIPFEIVKQGFVELGGGTIQNQDSQQRMKDIVKAHLPKGWEVKGHYFSKTGSSHILILYLNVHSETIDVSSIKSSRLKLLKNLNDDFSNLELEIILDDLQ